MRLALSLKAVFLLGGLLVFHNQADWPSESWLLGLIPALWLLFRGGRWQLIGWFMLGMTWPLLWISPIQLQLPLDWETEDVVAQGWIATLPERLGQHDMRFELAEVSLSRNGQSIALQGRVQLTWYKVPTAHPQVGEPWRFTVRLRRPRSFSNPAGFDYERWLFNRQIAARGSIRKQAEPQRLVGEQRYPVTRLRQHIATRLQELLPAHPLQGVLSALAIGDRQAISQDQWRVFNATGTTHLMAISGLHIGLVAGLVYFLAYGVWSRSAVLLHAWPAPKAAMLSAWCGACAYAALAGFALPTQRALLMLAVVTLARLTARPWQGHRVLALALIAVLLYDPLAPLSAGFWLSFSAVAVLIFLLAGRSQAWFKRLFLIQLVLPLALLPASLWFFQSATLAAPLANIIAIPWISTLVVPFTLLGAIFSLVNDTLAQACLQLAATNMKWLWYGLQTLSSFNMLLLKLPAPPPWTLVFALPGIFLLLAPRGMPGRYLALPLCLPLLFFPQSAPAPGQAWFTLLDVGDGLAAVIRTQHHVLVYDTGSGSGRSLDTGRTVLVPYLYQQGLQSIDTLIISHAAAHHSGGVRSLRAAFPINTLLSGTPAQIAIPNIQSCQVGQHWHWDGVLFRILHPTGKGHGAENSCVLLVQAGAHKLLLLGDLQGHGIQALLPQLAAISPINILVAPWHGWRPLTEPDLLHLSQPDYVLFSSRHKNRYGYPRPETWASYAATGAQTLNTATEGAIQFVLGAPVPLQAQSFRRDKRRYWHTP